MMLPQYLKTTDPDTVATVKANDDDRRQLAARILDFRDKHGAARAKAYGMDGLGISHLEWDGDRPAGWKKDGTPYKKNSEVYAEFQSLRHKDRAIPGLPGNFYLESGRNDGCGWFIEVEMFERSGVAYAKFPRPIDSELTSPTVEIGEQWIECLSSKFFAAREQVTA